MAFYPLWWALGLGTFIVPLIAVPMAWYLLKAGRPNMPPGFSWWLAFMAWTFFSLVMLGYTPPGTLDDAISGRAMTALFRIGLYASLTIILLYSVSIPREHMSAKRLAWLLGLMFAYTVAGGFLGVLSPSFEFTSPVEYLLPEGVRANVWISSMVHPSAAQVQDFLGYDVGRPAAPFGFTNKWGANFALLVPFFVAAWIVLRRRSWSRIVWVGLLLVSVVPVVQSVNRGLWVALVVMAVLTLARLSVRGHSAATAVGLVGLVMVATMIVATPLGEFVGGRMANQHSNVIREFSTERAIEASSHSPLLGFGTTRRAEGSARSIAVGRTNDCPTCGNTPLGQNGQFFLVLISQGAVGVVLFYGMFVQGILRWWRRPDVLGQAGLLSLVAGFVMSFYYDMMVGSVLLWMLGISVLWLSELEARNGANRTAVQGRLLTGRRGTT